MVMVSRPNFGRVGYLRGPKWAPNERKSIFWAFFVYFWSFLLISLILSYLCDWNCQNTIPKGRCSNKMADFKASGYFRGPWTSIISTFCLYFGIFEDFLNLSSAKTLQSYFWKGTGGFRCQIQCWKRLWWFKRSTDWKSASSWRLYVAPLPVYRYQCFLPFFSQFRRSAHFGLHSTTIKKWFWW